MPEGHVCTLSPGRLCCHDDCLALSNFTSKSENYKLAGVNVVLTPRDVQPLSKPSNVTNILETFNDEHAVIGYADEAMGKMFEFAVTAIKHIDTSTSLLSHFWKPSVPNDVIDAATNAVVAIDRLISTERNTIASWLGVTDRVKATPGASEIDIFYQKPSSLIRGVLNKVRWFNVVVRKGIHDDPSKALLLAKMVLHQLGANHKLLDDVNPEVPLGLHGAIPISLDVFIAQAGLPKSFAYQDVQERVSSIMFAADISGETYSAFCLALDGNAGKRDADPSAQLTFYPSYFTNLTEREHNLLLHTSFVREVIVQPLERELHEALAQAHRMKRSYMVKPKPQTIIPGGHDGNANRVVKRDEDWKTVMQEDSEMPLTSVSQTRDLPLGEQNYTYTSPAGKGVTIFIIGGGLRFNNDAISVSQFHFNSLIPSSSIPFPKTTFWVFAKILSLNR